MRLVHGDDGGEEGVTRRAKEERRRSEKGLFKTDGGTGRGTVWDIRRGEAGRVLVLPCEEAKSEARERRLCLEKDGVEAEWRGDG